ncbi:hypothetical protein EV182_001516 [Spiromyces aspiralis]|uniref:Uncharacterized protein n=1 Tax=Spiromyces aspiralis TaxID=68401 RepID=A0ACC1HIW2_9FUNG|nr:hypothetical protein EV182_001516 [Spiromyces aspiralis]
MQTILEADPPALTSTSGTVPGGRHSEGDDSWLLSLVLIVSVSIVLLLAFGVMLKKSFRLVPTGFIALRRLVAAPGPNQDELDPSAETQQSLLGASDAEDDSHNPDWASRERNEDSATRVRVESHSVSVPDLDK